MPAVTKPGYQCILLSGLHHFVLCLIYMNEKLRIDAGFLGNVDKMFIRQKLNIQQNKEESVNPKPLDLRAES